jgi:uncharacterized membrane protein
MPPAPASPSPAQLARAAGAALASLLVLDAVWIGAVGPLLGVDFVRGVVPAVQRAPLAARPLPALLAYASMTAAVVRAALRRGVTPGLKGAACRAGEAGLYIYSIFEATNAFMFSAWPARAVLLDSAWGAALFGAAGAAAAAAAGW